MNQELQNRHQKYKILAHLAEIFSKKLSEETIFYMLKSFEDISAEHFDGAIRSIIENDIKDMSPMSMPTPEQIRDKVFSEFDDSPPVADAESFTEKGWMLFCKQRDREERGMTEDEYKDFLNHYWEKYGKEHVPTMYKSAKFDVQIISEE